MVLRTSLGCAAVLALAACGHDRSPPREPATVAPTPTQPTSTWMRVLHGALADVEVERAAYDAGEPDHFQIRARVRNLTATPIAIDLRARRPGLYVNQWEVSNLDHREVIDERRAMRAPLDATAQAELRAAMAAGSLTTIAGGATLDLYGSFNASGRAAVDARPGRWLLLAVDGSVAITDGVRVDDLRLGDDEATRVIAVPAPVAWRPVPPGARRLPD